MASQGRDEPPARRREAVVRLDLDPEAVLPALTSDDRLAKVGIAGASPPSAIRVQTTYFDTTELDLLRSQVTLGRREGGGDDGWHLQLPEAEGTSVEASQPLDAGSTESPPPQLAALLRGTARGRPLAPVARLVTNRTSWILRGEDESELVAIADDRVRSYPLRPGGAPDGRWREVRVELLGGGQRHLRAAVSALRGVGGRPPRPGGEVARALALMPTPGAPDRTAGGVIIAAIAGYRDELIAVDRGLRQQAEPAVHDARSTARRIRSVLRVYGSLFVSDAGLGDQLRDLGTALSPARDREVQRERLMGTLAREPEEFGDPVVARIAAALDGMSNPANAHGDPASVVQSVGYLRLLRELDAFVAHPQFASTAADPARKALAKLLREASKGLRRKVSRALGDTADDEPRHDARKAAKTVRYAAEAAASVLGAPARRYVRAVGRVQETLGSYNDAIMTGELLLRLNSDPAATSDMGFAIGRVYAVEQQFAAGALGQFTKAWSDLVGSKLWRQFGG